MEVELTKEHLDTVKNLREMYISLHDEIGGFEREMEILVEKAKKLTDALEKTRESETIFFGFLSQIYGEGNFDINKMKWITTEVTENIENE